MLTVKTEKANTIDTLKKSDILVDSVNYSRWVGLTGAALNVPSNVPI